MRQVPTFLISGFSLHIGNIWIGSGGLNLYDNTARLHDPILCSFTTPDPQALKYPGINPYSHCAGNPTNIIDPTGEDIYYLTQYGVIYDVTPNTELIQFFILKDGVEVEIFNEKNKNPDIVTMEHKKREDGVDYDLYTIKNDKIAKQLFEALAQNTKVEWGHIIPKGKNKNNYITTSHLTNRDVGVTRESKLAAYHNDISYIIHSHPGNTPDPSGINDWESDNVHSDIKAGLNINLVIYYLNGGKKNFDNIKKKFPTYKIYTPGTNKYHPYQIPLELISDKK